EILISNALATTYSPSNQSPYNIAPVRAIQSTISMAYPTAHKMPLQAQDFAFACGMGAVGMAGINWSSSGELGRFVPTHTIIRHPRRRIYQTHGTDVLFANSSP